MADATIRLGYDDKDVQSGLARSAAHVKRFESQTKGLFSGIGSSLRAGLGTLGIGIGVSELKSFFGEFDRIGDLADQLNTTPEQIQKIGLMAEQSGSDVETLANAMNKVNRASTTVEGRKAFKELNIDVASFKSQKADEQIVMLADAFQRAEARGAGLSQVSVLMGKGFKELLPLLRTSNAELKAFSQTNVVSDAQVRAIQQLGDVAGHATQKVKAFGASGIMELLLQVNRIPMTGALLSTGKGVGEAWKAAGDALQKYKDDMSKAPPINPVDEEAIKNLKAQLDSLRDQTDAAIGTPVERTLKAIEIQRRKINELNEQLGDHPSDDDEESLNILIEKEKVQRDLNGLQDQYKSLLKDESTEQQKRLRAIADLQTQMKVLELRNAGKGKEANALEKEARLREEARRLAKDANMDEQKALQMVREKHKLEDEAEKRANRRHGHIQGFSQSRNRNLDPANRFRGLDEFNRMQGSESIFDRHLRTPGLDNLRRLQEKPIDPATGKPDRLIAFPRTDRMSTADKAAAQSQKTVEDLLRKIDGGIEKLNE